MSTQYRWLTDLSQQFLEKDYLTKGQTVDERVDVICNTAEQILGRKNFARDFKENFQKGWYSLSTPIWTNFGNKRGLPISCFGSYIEDNTESILFTQAEVSMMTKNGGGTSADFSALRCRGSLIQSGANGYSGGPVHFMQTFHTNNDVWSQGSARRGSFSPYLSIEHPDILEFLQIKGDGNPIQHISPGVLVSDNFLRSMIAGDTNKRKVWAKVLESRNNTGFPYIIFIDNANKFAADVYRNLGLRINHSNLCTEIFLPDSSIESFVCDLASMNDLYYEEWQHTNAVELLVYLLDAVMTEFIRKASDIKFMERAVRFGERHRALGIGQIGWHSFLQSKMILYESMDAKRYNVAIAKNIYESAYKASTKMALTYGKPDVLKGEAYNRRHTTLIAIAPTTSSAFIIGQASEHTQPIMSNHQIKDLAKGKFSIKNTYLEKLLAGKGCNTDEVWNQILHNNGSVQTLSCLSEDEKKVFKTFIEISPMEVIIQAAQRQKYIDQGQSLNVIIDPDTPVRDVNKLILTGWELGLKSFYYQINVNAAQQLTNSILQCSSCEA